MQKNVKNDEKKDEQTKNNRDHKKGEVGNWGGDSATDENMHPRKKGRMDFGEIMTQPSEIEETSYIWS